MILYVTFRIGCKSSNKWVHSLLYLQEYAHEPTTVRLSTGYSNELYVDLNWIKLHLQGLVTTGYATYCKLPNTLNINTDTGFEPSIFGPMIRNWNCLPYIGYIEFITTKTIIIIQLLINRHCITTPNIF